MILCDVNVLVLAHRRDHAEHDVIRDWLEREVNSERPFALAHGAAVATRDRGFARFSGLRWLDPLLARSGE